ncbi:hypothetical protein PF005_g27774 [Phytophthora fragariae]|uniref:Uncharacterized protein n=1 Tax=Phytophthora fragariae TaxID=53985 RepID=A0A6A3VY87_9STRA|nr:hypothetical protein PF005_g27774 [Phytophthora fragariae]
MCVQWKELKFEKKNMVKKVVQSDSDVGMNKRYGCSSTSSIALSVDDSKVADDVVTAAVVVATEVVVVVHVVVAAEVEVAEVAVAEASGEPGVAQFTTEGWRFRRLNGNDRVPVPSASRINLSAVLDCLCFVTKFGSSDDIAL